MEEIALGILRVGNASAPKAEKLRARRGKVRFFLGWCLWRWNIECVWKRNKRQSPSSYGVANRDHVSGEERGRRRRRRLNPICRPICRKEDGKAEEEVEARCLLKQFSLCVSWFFRLYYGRSTVARWNNFRPQTTSKNELVLKFL